MLKTPEHRAAAWKRTAVSTLATAKLLRDGEDHRSCVSRAYYAAYQAATSVCVAHGDSAQFPAGWNNPTHDQLPDLIMNNGGLNRGARRTVRRILRELRHLREDADYRVAVTVDSTTAVSALLMVSTVFDRLEIEYVDERNNRG